MPTVALAIQQHKVLSENIPDVQARVLSGADGVDRWDKQSIWNDVLENIRLVVSTHQVRRWFDYHSPAVKPINEKGSSRRSRSWICPNEKAGRAGL